MELYIDTQIAVFQSFVYRHYVFSVPLKHLLKISESELLALHCAVCGRCKKEFPIHGGVADWSPLERDVLL
jgi:hypothetical protein